MKQGSEWTGCSQWPGSLPFSLFVGGLGAEQLLQAFMLPRGISALLSCFWFAVRYNNKWRLRVGCSSKFDNTIPMYITEMNSLFSYVASCRMWVSASSCALHSLLVCSQVWGTGRKIKVLKDFLSDDSWNAGNKSKILCTCILVEIEI